MSLDWNRQKTEEPSKQHGFAQFYFTHTFQLLGVSLGHIFKVRQSDVDMRDVVLNRRILVVNLPALESSDERLAALGKIVVASLRGMMAQMLGARLEGDSDVIVANKPGMGVAPVSRRARRGRLLRHERHGSHAGPGARPQHDVLARLPGSLGAFGRGSAKRPSRCSATPTSRSPCASRTPTAPGNGSRTRPGRPMSPRPRAMRAAWHGRVC